MTKITRVLPLTVVVTIAIAAAIILRAPTANAQSVQFVKICSLYGEGFFYLPGTDICVDFSENDAREPTAAGEWRWRIPNNPRTWVPTPQQGCQGGQLVTFGNITSSGLTLNADSRFETITRYPLNLKQGQYIASVLYKGGFVIPPPQFTVSDLPTCPAANTLVDDATDPYCTFGNAPVGGGVTTCEVTCVSGAWQFTGFSDNTVGQGTFCMFYFYTDPLLGPVYSFPLGCIDTSPQATVPATLMFSPDSPIPPAVSYQTYILGANGDSWEVPFVSDVQGTLSVWLCLQQVPGVKPAH